MNWKGTTGEEPLKKTTGMVLLERNYTEKKVLKRNY